MMRRKFIKMFLMPVLALSVALGACENIGGPGGLTGPPAGEPSRDLLGVLDGGSSNGFTVVKTKDASLGIVTGVIGPSGGKLVLGKHELWVPKGAVSSATTFTMSRDLGSELRFSLTATKLLPNDVGSAGFAVPVALVVNFQDATIEGDPSQLRIVWLKPDGSVQEQATDVDVIGKKAVGHLGHFSDYALVMP